MSEKGYSLAELSITMLISSFLYVGFMTFFVDLNKKNMEESTLNKLEKIEIALESYVKSHGKLPCPSSRVDPYESANLGLDSDCTLAIAPAGTVDFGAVGSEVRIGTLPVRELNLEREYIFDGWRNRFTYAVSKNLATTSANFRNYAPTGLGPFIIQDKNANQMNTSTDIAYVVTSHGPGGIGAYNISGVLKNACVIGSGDENCNEDNIFTDAFLYPTPETSNYVRWKTRNHIIKATGLIIPIS